MQANLASEPCEREHLKIATPGATEQADRQASSGHNRAHMDKQGQGSQDKARNGALEHNLIQI